MKEAYDASATKPTSDVSGPYPGILLRPGKSDFRTLTHWHSTLDVSPTGPLRRFCELTIFDARLYIRVRRVDQPA
jgi:hypothetical protein